MEVGINEYLFHIVFQIRLLNERILFRFAHSIEEINIDEKKVV